MNKKHYTEYPGYFSDVPFDELLGELTPFFGTNVIYGNVAKRESCKFTSRENVKRRDLSSYGNAMNHSFEASPWIVYIKKELEDLTGEKYDYVLAHLYPDGQASIMWHNDKEALYTQVSSVSFGATRRMKFRMLGETKGCIQEFLLAHGDVLVMEEGCQTHYAHQIPKEAGVKKPRINLTFRKF
jgi:alkylated DNA repair dioxygenase AlkB